MRKEGIAGIILISLILCSFGVLAAFSYKSENLVSVYSGGESIAGTINISFSNQEAHSMVTSNFRGNITLLELLKKNNFSEGKEYNCTRLNCEIGYQKIEEITSEGIDLEGDPVVIGFEIKTNGELLEDLSRLKLSITSDAGKSCDRQISVDILERGEVIMQNSRNSGELCGSEETGCFDSDASSAWADLGSNLYCENMTLPAAPAFKIGANLKNGTANANIKMGLYDFEGNSLGECTLPKNNESIQKIGCTINYSLSEERSLFVCASSDNEDAGYGVRVEQESPNCGTSVQGPPFNKDYDFFARPLKFDSVGVMDINETTFGTAYYGESLAAYAFNYITQNYENNCSKGCVVPFKISGIAQHLDFDNAELRYSIGGQKTTISGLYKFEERDALITSPVLRIDIGKAEFTIPVTSNETELYLYLDDEPILESPIDIEITPGFDFDVFPKTVLYGVKTSFSAITGAIINSSSWKFGDGEEDFAEGKTISHRYTTYNPEGYAIEVELERSDGVTARRTFNLAVEGLNDSLNAIIKEDEKKLSDINAKLGTLTPALSKAVKDEIGFDGINLAISSAKNSQGNLTMDEDYLVLIENLLALSVPESVSETESGSSLPLVIGFESIDVSQILEISDVQIESEAELENLKKAIVVWFENKYGAAIDYKIISRTDDFGSEPILTYIKINLNPKAESSGAYLLLNYPSESIGFLGNYSEKTTSSGVYIPLDGITAVEFTIIGEVDPSNLGVYISPEVSQVYEEIGVAAGPEFSWKRFFLGIFLLLIVAFAVYIALQEWYKKNYEAHLFKNQNDLYNSLNFISNSRKSNVKDSEIRKKLESAGWSGEQIEYSFKKIDGKRTGMYEIPVLRFFEKRKIEKELAKRQHPQIATTALLKKEAGSKEPAKEPERKGFFSIFKKR
ncbi:MAG: hypothetical protein MUF61_00175 [archaeon]|jgi:hypothetical protein|nr:hypothetical protein [archaeon]